ncbi:sensor histidine kinase [Agromyces sp. MMS24-JH15]|uniref:sensor histidine kinase n=1 Tax=Agromyces sp. MMS24-JH15 TaxID=3243765 RepID=UPI003748D951
MPHPSGQGPWPPPPRVVLFVPVVASLLIQVPATVAVIWWQRPGPVVGAALVALAIAGPLVLLAARRLPGPTVAIESGLALAAVLTGVDGPPYVALAFAIVLGMARGAVAWAAASVATGWLAAIGIGVAVGLDWHPFRVVLATAGLAACFAVGAFVRVRRARAAEFRAEAQRRRQSAEERERVRIARELHDVVGHALSQINVQASVGLHLMDRDPEQGRIALANVKAASKQALEEVRSVLGVMRSDGEAPLAPQAGFDQLPALVAGVGSPALDAELDDRLDARDGRPAHPVQLAAYRIAQEALTNVVRHADAASVRVVLEREAGDLVLSVQDDGRGLPPDGSDAVGMGVLGMRERAALLGGSVEIGAGPEGRGTRVRARLPWSVGG